MRAKLKHRRSGKPVPNQELLFYYIVDTKAGDSYIGGGKTDADGKVEIPCTPGLAGKHPIEVRFSGSNSHRATKGRAEVWATRASTKIDLWDGQWDKAGYFLLEGVITRNTDNDSVYWRKAEMKITGNGKLIDHIEVHGGVFRGFKVGLPPPLYGVPLTLRVQFLGNLNTGASESSLKVVKKGSRFVAAE